MFDDLGALFMNNVIAAYDEYVVKRDAKKSGRDQHLRAAVELATALFHFREQLPIQLAQSQSDVETACPDYRLIADVANATKHAQLTRQPPQRALLITSADKVQELVAITLFEDPEGTYSDAQTVIIANCSNGTIHNLDLALTSVLNFWSGLLSQARVITYPQVVTPPIPGTRLIQRKDAKSVDLELLNTIRFRGAMQILKFDATKGYAEPMDLSSKQFEMRIYKPPNIIDITASIPEHGKVTVSIELPDAQAIALHRLKAGADKAAFMKSVFQERAEEILQKVAAAMQGKAELTSTDQPSGPNDR